MKPLIILIACALFSCSSPTQHNENEFLIGKWEGKYTERTYEGSIYQDTVWISYNFLSNNEYHLFLKSHTSEPNVPNPFDSLWGDGTYSFDQNTLVLTTKVLYYYADKTAADHVSSDTTTIEKINDRQIFYHAALNKVDAFNYFPDRNK